MFDRFKENHGGYGPLKVANAAAHGLDWHTMAAAQKQWSATFDAIAQDDSLPDAFKRQAQTIRTGKYPVAQALDILGQVSQRAGSIKAINSGADNMSEQLGKLRSGAKLATDNTKLDEMETSLKTFRGFANSGDQKLMATGVDGLSQLTKDMRDYSTSTEARDIAAAARFGDNNLRTYATLQDNYRQESAPFLVQRHSVDAVHAGLGAGNFSGDLAALYSLMKMYDPASVVREGELATAQNAQGVPTLILSLYNHTAKDGALLSNDQRKEMLQQADAQFGVARSEQLERNTRYLGQARDSGIPETMLNNFALPLDAVMGPPKTFGQPEQEAPKAGPGAGPDLTDSPSRMVGDSVRDSLFNDLGTGEFLRGLFNLKNKQEEPPNPYPRKGIINRNTDEFK